MVILSTACRPAIHGVLHLIRKQLESLDAKLVEFRDKPTDSAEFHKVIRDFTSQIAWHRNSIALIEEMLK